MKSIIRFIMELFSSPNSFSNLMSYIPYIALIGFSLYIANYVSKRYTGRAKGLIMLGAILKAINLTIQLFMNFVVIPNMSGGYGDISLYFKLNSLLGASGGLLFLYGIYLLLKDFLGGKDNEFSDFDNNNDSGDTPNSFIERM